MKKRGPSLIRYFTHNIAIVFALVLIWRGIWYALDRLDLWFFGGGHLISAIGGVILGFAILYIPDKDLKEIEKL
jgi:hypothetical protein